jgi:DNA polymerase-3 subunit epsilon
MKKQPFACVDLELTGLSVETDRIIEVAVVKFTFEENLESYETLIDPEISIPEASTAIHHITNEMVQGKPKIAEVLTKVLSLLKNEVIIGHGVGFDLAVLEKEALRSGILVSFPKDRIVDTLRLARLYGQSPTNSLEMLRHHFNIQEEGAHRAMSDVIVNIQVFKHLAKQFRSLNELLERLKHPILMKAMPLGKHKGRAFAELPLDYLRWAVRQEFDQDLIFSLQTEMKKRKKGTGFQQSCRPFQDLDFSENDR